jgi:acyl carrier protein phosphodiesterase
MIELLSFNVKFYQIQYTIQQNPHLCKKQVLNFLAHLYLAGNNDGLIIGNFIADMVKGKSYLNYSEPIQNGILLHRQIDSFTDTHPIFRKTKRRILKDQGPYSGVVVDMFYDHFLAIEWPQFSNEKLDDFVCRNYRLMIKNYRILPERARYILPYLVRQNWLSNYAKFEPLSLIFDRMDRRTNYRSGMKTGVETLKKHYPEIKKDFYAFMPEISDFVENMDLIQD